MAKDLKNLLIYHIHDGELGRLGQRYLKGRLIDIGCGTKPYRALLAPFVSEHVGVDREDPFHPEARPDLIGTAYEIPVPDASFDSAICTAALEHLNEPEAAVVECRRVLKPGGYAIYSVPFIWHVHAAPWDFYRFTHFALRHVFEKHGFEVVELKPLSGFWVTFGQLFVYYLYRFNRRPITYTFIIPILGLLVQACAFVLDKIDRAEDWTWMYMLVARKPAAAGAVAPSAAVSATPARV